MPATWDADPQPFIGGLISEQAALNVLKAGRTMSHAARNLAGAEAGSAGHVAADAGIVEMSGASNVPDEEVFGPLLCVWRYDDFDSAIAMANNTRYGLSSGLISPQRESLISCCSKRAPGLLTGTNR